MGEIRYHSARPNLEVREITPTLAFLTDVLRFDVVAAEGEPVTFTIIASGGASFAVFVADGAAVPTAAACYVELDGVVELERRCREAGAVITAELTDRPWGLRDFVVQLPSGHQIAFGERIGGGVT